MSDLDLLIVGAGCAGLSTAISALHTTPDLNILILEKRSKIGLKGCSGGISSWLITKLATDLYLDKL
ncbi:MAG: FAD-dependent oxidoreductase, partial [Candidatus Aenigmarchaeota archaeon]|nr:FAD-dependent oxidoreductase [Candidatus Aenigmarchaeota archaeon]